MQSANVEFKVGEKVRSGNGTNMIIGTVTEIGQPQAPYFVTWVRLDNVVRMDGTPSKKHKKGLWVNATTCHLYDR